MVTIRPALLDDNLALPPEVRAKLAEDFSAPGTPIGSAIASLISDSDEELATTAAPGVVELATDEATVEGLDPTRAVTPTGVAAAIAAIPASSSASGVVYLAAPSTPLAYRARADMVVPALGAQEVIAAAINAGPVLLLPGDYYINAPIVVTTQHPHVQGSGSATEIHLSNNMNSYGFLFSPQSGLGIRGLFEDFKIDGNGSNQTAGGGIHGIGAVQSSFRRVWITNAFENGLWLDSFAGNGAGAFGHHNKVLECLFDNTLSFAGLGRGLNITGSDENLITSEFQFLGGTAGRTYAARDQSGLNNFIGSVFVGGRNNLGGIELRDGRQSVVNGCVFDGVSGDNVFVASSAGHRITNNTLVSVGDQSVADDHFSGIHLEFAVQNCIVSDNIILTSPTAGKTRSLIREEASGDTGLNIITNNNLRPMGVGTPSVGYLELAGTGSLVGPNFVNGILIPGPGATAASVAFAVAPKLDSAIAAATYTPKAESVNRAMVNADALADLSRIRNLFSAPAQGVFVLGVAPATNQTSTTLQAATVIGATTLPLTASLTPGFYKVDAENVQILSVTGSASPYTATLAAATTAAHASGAAIATREMDYAVFYGLGGGRYGGHEIPYVTNTPPAYTYGLNQLDSCGEYVALQSVDETDASVTRVGTWTNGVQSKAFGGNYRWSATLGDTTSWTSPAGATRLGIRTVTGVNGGLSKVTIDGSATAADLLPTAQQVVNSGAYHSSILVANGGALDPTDRVLDSYVAGGIYNYDACFAIAENLAAGAHAVVITATGYQGKSLTSSPPVGIIAAGRTSVSGLASGTASILLSSPSAWPFRAEMGNVEVKSAYEYAIECLAPGSATVGTIGTIHGYERQDSLTVLLDRVATTLPAGMLVQALSSVELRRTSTLYHPQATGAVGSCTATYRADRQGLTFTPKLTLIPGMTLNYLYSMMPLSGCKVPGGMDRAASTAFGTVLTLTGATDVRVGAARSAAAWMWNSTKKTAFLHFVPDIYDFTDGWAKGGVSPHSFQDRLGQISKSYLSNQNPSATPRVTGADWSLAWSAHYQVGYFPAGAEAALALA